MRNLSERNPDETEKNNNQNKLGNTLGLAKKAGAIIAGTELVIDAVRKKKACHVFMCSDVSPGTSKKILDKTAFYQVPVTKLNLTMSELARYIGLLRLTAAVAITNKNFLKLINLSNLPDLTDLTEKSTEVHL